MALPTIFQLADSQLRDIAAILKRHTGIVMTMDKRELIKSRLSQRLRELGLESFREYIKYLELDKTGTELITMLDALSTNVTHFFREADHFDYLKKNVFSEDRWKEKKAPHKMRIWSAACSSGEEPYSLAITALDSIGNISAWDMKILATDLSTHVLAQAKQGVYKLTSLKTLPPFALHKYFTGLEGRGHERFYSINANVRQLVSFARLNFFTPWPMRGPFDVIMCRNAMIYFDQETQQELVNRFWEKLGPGGLLLVGHSESLNNLKHNFEYVKPTIYKKRGKN